MTTTQPEVTPEELFEVEASFSPELRELLGTRADLATTNWLFYYGIPDTPAHVRQLVHVIYKGVTALLVAEGWASLTDKASASDEEKAERKAQQEASGQQLFDPAAFDAQFKVGGNGAGGYI